MRRTDLTSTLTSSRNANILKSIHLIKDNSRNFKIPTKCRYFKDHVTGRFQGYFFNPTRKEIAKDAKLFSTVCTTKIFYNDFVTCKNNSLSPVWGYVPVLFAREAYLLKLEPGTKVLKMIPPQNGRSRHSSNLRKASKSHSEVSILFRRVAYRGGY